MGPDVERQTPVEVTAKVRCGDGQRKKEASIALKWKTFGRSRGSSNSFKLRNLTKLGQDMAKTEQLLLSYCQRSCAGGRKGLVVPGLVPKTAAQM